MLQLTRIKLLSYAAAGALLALVPAGTPAHANEVIQNFGPVASYEPILTAVGDERVIAFYLPDNGRCAVHVVVWDNPIANSLIAKFWGRELTSAKRFRIDLSPGQITHIDSVDNESLDLQCGDNAATLAIVDSDEHIAFGTSTPKHVKASASGF